MRGSGVEAAQPRELESFSAIEVGGNFNLVVHVEPSESQRVEVRGDDNLISEVHTYVRNGELEIGFKDIGVVRPKLPLTVEVWVPSLSALEAAGSTDVTVDGLHGDSFEIDIAGSADIRLSGQVRSFEIDIAGSADVDARELKAAIVEADIAGSADADVHVSERLDVDVAGSGSVRYWGQPTDIRHDIAGSGSVEAAS